MKKIIVYDFDKTLTKNDTLLGFFIFNEKRNILFYFKYILYFLLMIFTKFRIINNSRLKDYGIKLFLAQLSKKDFEYKCKNYKNFIKYNFLFKKVNFEKEDIYIISASFEDYLKYIFPKNVKILASSLDYKNNKITGLKFNCYGANKIKTLDDLSIKEIDIFYTDSISDLPLVEISKKTILIKNDLEIECNNKNEFINKV